MRWMIVPSKHKQRSGVAPLNGGFLLKIFRLSSLSPPFPRIWRTTSTRVSEWASGWHCSKIASKVSRWVWFASLAWQVSCSKLATKLESEKAGLKVSRLPRFHRWHSFPPPSINLPNVPLNNSFHVPNFRQTRSQGLSSPHPKGSDKRKTSVEAGHLSPKK